MWQIWKWSIVVYLKVALCKRRYHWCLVVELWFLLGLHLQKHLGQCISFFPRKVTVVVDSGLSRFSSEDVTKMLTLFSSSLVLINSSLSDKEQSLSYFLNSYIYDCAFNGILIWKICSFLNSHFISCLFSSGFYLTGKSSIITTSGGISFVGPFSFMLRQSIIKA